jgi:hypothetical protein
LRISRRRCWLFYLPLGRWRPICLLLAAMSQALAQAPMLTAIRDNVFRVDGSPAAGTPLISWPALTTAAGATVAAGNNSVILGTIAFTRLIQAVDVEVRTALPGQVSASWNATACAEEFMTAW